MGADSVFDRFRGSSGWVIIIGTTVDSVLLVLELEGAAEVHVPTTGGDPAELDFI